MYRDERHALAADIPVSTNPNKHIVSLDSVRSRDKCVVAIVHGDGAEYNEQLLQVSGWCVCVVCLKDMGSQIGVAACAARDLIKSRPRR